MSLPIFVIIATSGKRTHQLLNVALPSVLQQTLKPLGCFIIDDNVDFLEGRLIRQEFEDLQKQTIIQLSYLRNHRTPGHSGTGAWNTGIEAVRGWLDEHQLLDAYILILDDDDQWTTNHIQACQPEMRKGKLAIFPWLTRVYSSYHEPSKLKHTSQLTPGAFLLGNPGVQGSNMCFRLSAIEAIQGFDEQLHSCTDRDLMIRFLDRWGNKEISIIHQETVLHDARHKACVTNDPIIKAKGLDRFYAKYLHRFTQEQLAYSLARAERLFGYTHSTSIEQAYASQKRMIGVIMPFHNASSSLKRSVHSVLSQLGTQRNIRLFLGNDQSNDSWEDAFAEFKDDPRIQLTHLHQGGIAARARNELQDYVLQNFPCVEYLCRLDADDVFASPHTLAEVERHLDSTQAKVLLAGNHQYLGEKCVGLNLADQAFFNPDYMADRLKRMAGGDPQAELPSCNLVIHRDACLDYPDEVSAEDHWLIIKLLLHYSPEEMLLAQDLIYCHYQLEGSTSKSNQAKHNYKTSRQRLYEYYLQAIR